MLWGTLADSRVGITIKTRISAATHNKYNKTRSAHKTRRGRDVFRQHFLVSSSGRKPFRRINKLIMSCKCLVDKHSAQSQTYTRGSHEPPASALTALECYTSKIRFNNKTRRCTLTRAKSKIKIKISIQTVSSVYIHNIYLHIISLCFSINRNARSSPGVSPFHPQTSITIYARNRSTEHRHLHTQGGGGGKFRG